MTKENHLPASCKVCLSEWEQPVALPMDMSEFAKAVKKMQCPACGSKAIVFSFSGGK